MGLTVNGLDLTLDAFADIAEMPDEIAEEILNEQADIVIRETTRTGRSMGVHRTGDTLGSLKKSRPAHLNGTHSIKVEFAGKNRHGERNATVAFINEYGKTNQPARPFVSTALEKADAEIQNAAENAVDKYLKKKGF